MGKRSTSRRLAVQALYQAEYGKIDIKQALENLFEQENFIKDTVDFSYDLAQGAWKERNKIGHLIEKYSKNWRVERMGGVDRNILRLALYEMMIGETPVQVVINEAVELAKKYSTLEAAKFINGILGAYKKDRDKGEKS